MEYFIIWVIVVAVAIGGFLFWKSKQQNKARENPIIVKQNTDLAKS